MHAIFAKGRANARRQYLRQVFFGAMPGMDGCYVSPVFCVGEPTMTFKELGSALRLATLITVLCGVECDVAEVSEVIATNVEA